MPHISLKRTPHYWRHLVGGWIRESPLLPWSTCKSTKCRLTPDFQFITYVARSAYQKWPLPPALCVWPCSLRREPRRDATHLEWPNLTGLEYLSHSLQLLVSNEVVRENYWCTSLFSFLQVISSKLSLKASVKEPQFFSAVIFFIIELACST